MAQRSSAKIQPVSRWATVCSVRTPVDSTLNNNSITQRIADLLAAADKPDSALPPTDLYNEGWMLRLVLDWFSKNQPEKAAIKFADGARWYSEALLPSAFLTRERGDPLSESWTHADGVVGHFDIGANGAGDLTLKANATQLVVIEAKMGSKLSAGVKNASYYNQAARNVACMAEVARRASIAPASFDNLAFYVFAPQSKIDEGIFTQAMDVDQMRDVVQRRVAAYEETEKQEWLDNWFLPVCEKAEIRCVSWEEVLTVIGNHNSLDGRELQAYYEKCLRFNNVDKG